MSAISVATIYPFHFAIPIGFPANFSLVREFDFGSNIQDYWQNILLFMPFGVSLAAIISNKERNYFYIIITCTAASAIASTTVESIQIFLPIRVSNLSDIICNTLGGGLGANLYFYRQEAIALTTGLLTFNHRKLRVNSLLIAIFGYCGFVLLAVWLLLVNVNLSNWDEDYYLALGNEISGDRPWNGVLDRLYICDRVLSNAEIVEAFQSAEQSDLFFKQFPGLVTSIQSSSEQNVDVVQHPSVSLDLAWRTNSSSFDWEQSRKSQQSEVNSGIAFNRHRWLQSDRPATDLIRKLKQSQEFSLFLSVAPKEVELTEYARILTISKGLFSSNVLVGQNKSDLHFRLRTAIIPDLSNQPDFVIPDVFEPKTYSKILITFGKRKLSFYIEDYLTKYTFEFVPSITYVSYSPWRIGYWVIDLSDYNLNIYTTWFYTIITVPFIILIANLAYYLSSQLTKNK